jgi:prepilin-type N-terminal cleavage/methylation domain-containing protein
MAHGSRHGVTILELLTVVVIFSILLALAVSFLQGANKDLGVAAAANGAVGVLRVAHQQSRSTSSPSWVVLDTKGNRIYLLLKETVGEWHLEDMITTGAFGKDGKVSAGGTQAQVGRVGKAIQHSGSAAINFGEVPQLAANQGLAIEFWYLRRQGRGRGVLCTVGNDVEVVTESDGHVEAKVGPLRASSGQIRVPVDAWCYLQLIYSGRELKLLLNRREVQAVPGKADWTKGGVFIVGGAGFTGIVDEVRLGLILPRDEVVLPAEVTMSIEGVQLPESGEVVVAFDSEGRLDPSVSPQPFAFTVKSSADSKRIVIGPGGTLQSVDRPPEK